MKLKILLFVIFIIQIVKAQGLPVKIIEYLKDNIAIKVEVKDIVYNCKDTILFKVVLINNTGNIVYFMDLLYNDNFESAYWNQQRSSYIFNYGGEFWVDLGKIQYIKLLKVKPKAKKVIYCKLSLKEHKYISKELGYDNEWFAIKNVEFLNSEFYFAYIYNTPKLNLDFQDKNGLFIFKSDTQAMIFEKALNRVHVGPILLRKIK